MKKVLDKFRPSIKGSVCVVGCGTGEFMELIKDKVVDVYGITNNEDDLQELKQKGLRGAFMLLENIHVYIDRKFETVMLIDVINDFTHRHALLRNCQWLMDSDSLLLVKTIDPVDISVIEHFEDIFTVNEIDGDQYFIMRKYET